MKNAEIRQLINGPESYTPDLHAIMGESPNVMIECKHAHSWSAPLHFTCIESILWFELRRALPLNSYQYTCSIVVMILFYFKWSLLSVLFLTYIIV